MHDYQRIYAEILRLHIPSSCNVLFGGFLFDQNGNESKQIDVIINDDSSLQFNFNNKDGNGKSFSCIDGCIGIVSVKSKLDSKQMVESLNNISSIPDKQPLGGRINLLLGYSETEYDDWPYKIIYASDRISIESLMSVLHDYYIQDSSIPINKRPNLIHIAGKYVIIRIKSGMKRRDGVILEENSFYAQPDKNDVFGLLSACMRI